MNKKRKSTAVKMAIYLPPAVFMALNKQGEKENRSNSWLAGKLIADHFGVEYLVQSKIRPPRRTLPE